MERQGTRSGSKAMIAMPEAAIMADAEADRNLIVAVAAGKRSALATLYDRHADRMLGVANRILNNRRDAEDVLHDVFLEVWQKAKSFDASRGTVRNWLSLRVRSRAIDRLRTFDTARKHTMAEVNPEAEAVPVGTEPDRLTEQAQARQALACLADAQRAVVELSYFDDLTCREIADRCQIPVGTVKSRLAAAIARLRREFIPVQELGAASGVLLV